MASAPQLVPEIMVTLKVTYENTTRRVKMPLRDMVPQVLEANIRHFLHIPLETQIVIERYSDSASAFVVLDSNNLPVYKQLYRAAKAKSKLKLRVSVLQLQPKTTPMPVTVEDVPEASVVESHESTEKMTPAVTDESPSTTEPATEIPVPSVAPSSITLLSGVELPQGSTSSVLLDTAKAKVQEQTEVPVAQKLPANIAQPAPFDPQSIYSSFDDYCADDYLVPTDQQRPRVIAPAPVAVCCNNCEKAISEFHYHCQTCDDGDFDLCQACIDQAVSCYDDNHWLIKRIVIDGQLVASSTERIEPKIQAKKKTESLGQEASILPSVEKEILEITHPEKAPEQPAVGEPLKVANAPLFAPPRAPFVGAATSRWCLGTMRTCNCCVQELPEWEFLHCTTCEDFDLCKGCFVKDAHGHHPKHAFVSAVPGTEMPDNVAVRMGAGRNQEHHALCDGCDKFITGVRHKCLDCPDWDYCSKCILNAGFVHAKHRFAPIYEPLADLDVSAAEPVHMGIYCDGPLCSENLGYPTYIRGVRYKCAVCHDHDLCANCEAHPANEHNKTHPLIKFKTPVRRVSVTTTGEHQDGKRMPQMGDRATNVFRPSETSTLSDSNSINAVQTVVDVKPEEPETEEVKIKQEPEAEIETKKVEMKQEPTPEIEEEMKEGNVAAPVPSVNENDLRAVFIRDTVSDGTIMPPNHVFEQTWVLRNEGPSTWPAGCSVKFVGGDYMGHVDSAHPAGISELVSASESIVCYAPLAPGSEFPFTVLLRTPARAGQIISYWRLTTPDGFKFGHRLWCDVSVRMPPPEALPATTVEEIKKEEETQTGSVMIFPKLDKESPHASVHEELQTESVCMADETDTRTVSGEEDEWDGSDDEFMTDEEYDILDASDEEYLEDRENKKTRK